MILDGVVPFPIGCETRRFLAALTSLYMYIEKKEGTSFFAVCNNEEANLAKPCVKCKKCDTYETKARENVYQSILTASGIGVLCFQEDRLLTDQCKIVDHILEPASYIDNAMRFLGYNYRILRKDGQEASIQGEIVASLERGVPVIVRFGPGNYTLAIGYEENGAVLYGYDGKGGYNEIDYASLSARPEKYLNGTVYVYREWQNPMDMVILVDEKNENPMQLRDIAQVNIDIISRQHEAGYKTRLLQLFRDGAIEHDSEEQLEHLYRYINLYFGFLAEQRRFVGNTFGTHFINRDVGSVALPYLDTMAKIYFNSHDIAFIGWEAAGEISGGTPQDLKNPKKRQIIYDSLSKILENDLAVLSLLRIFRSCANMV